MEQERDAAKDNYGNSSITDLLDSNNPSLLTMTSCIRIDFACTLDMIEQNVGIMRKHEMA